MPKERLPFVTAIGGGSGVTRDGRLVTGVTQSGRALSRSDGRVVQPARRAGAFVPAMRRGRHAAPGVLPPVTPIPEDTSRFLPFTCTVSGAFYDHVTTPDTLFPTGFFLEPYLLHAPYEGYPDVITSMATLIFHGESGRQYTEEGDDWLFCADRDQLTAWAAEQNITIPTWMDTVPFGYERTAGTWSFSYAPYASLTMQGVSVRWDETVPRSNHWLSTTPGQWYIICSRGFLNPNYGGLELTATTAWALTTDTTIIGFARRLTLRYTLSISPANVVPTLTVEMTWWLPASWTLTITEGTAYTGLPPTLTQRLTGTEEEETTTSFTGGLSTPAQMFGAAIQHAAAEE